MTEIETSKMTNKKKKKQTNKLETSKMIEISLKSPKLQNYPKNL